MKILLDDRIGSDHALNANEACVYAAISKCSNGKGWYANYEVLANALPFAISGKTVSRAVKKLMNLGLVEERQNVLYARTICPPETDNLSKKRDNLSSPHTPLYINNKNKKDSVTRKSANNTQNLILTKKYFEIDMETITDALSRKDSMHVIWSLLNPAPEFRELYNDFMRYWNRIERDRQLQIWYFLKRKIDNKQPLDPNPLEVLKNCHPYPINYNGTPGVNTMIKSEHKMVKAYHNGAYGIYEEMDARLWHMTRIEPLNFRASTCGADLINK